MPRTREAALQTNFSGVASTSQGFRACLQEKSFSSHNSEKAFILLLPPALLDGGRAGEILEFSSFFIFFFWLCPQKDGRAFVEPSAGSEGGGGKHADIQHGHFSSGKAKKVKSQPHQRALPRHIPRASPRPAGGDLKTLT